MLGDSDVGKRKLLDHLARSRSASTLGRDYAFYRVGDESLRFLFRRVAGMESFRVSHRLYSKGASGALLVYDVTDRSTFDRVGTWLKEFRDHANFNTAVLLVGNKKDLEGRR